MAKDVNDILTRMLYSTSSPTTNLERAVESSFLEDVVDIFSHRPECSEGAWHVRQYDFL